MLYNENRQLDEDQKRRVLQRVSERGLACENCGSREFRVGDALDMSFLFLDEEQRAYMVALTCENPGCEAPRTGIRLQESEFLGNE